MSRQRRLPCLTILLVVFAAALAALVCASPSGRGEDAVPSSIRLDRRVPWTTGRIAGTPEPPPPYQVERVFPRLKFDQPVYLAAEPGSRRLLVIEREGKIFRFDDRPDAAQAELYLDLKADGYGLAFHPAFATNGYIYVVSNQMNGKRYEKNRLARYTASLDAARTCDRATEQVLLEWPSRGHNGGDLAFGPDGFLYITSGDGETGVDDPDPTLTGQDLSDLRSGILRIDVDHPTGDRPYGIPADNPFLDIPGARGELWAFGLRNPFRFCIDRQTGQMWIGDNGEEQWEAIYLGRRGANYGWSNVEGSHPFNLTRPVGPAPIDPPVVEHPHAIARSMVGGRIYRGRLLPDLAGVYLYGDHETGKVWGLTYDGEKVTSHREIADTNKKITAFVEDHDGELLLVAISGEIYRLVPTPAVQNAAAFPRMLSETGLFASTAEQTPAPGVIPYSVNAPAWNNGAWGARLLALPGDSQMEFRKQLSWGFPEGTVLVQTLSLPRVAGDEKSAWPIETRLLHNLYGQWRGYSYVWNEAGTDAELAPREGTERRVEIGGTENGQSASLRWRFHGRSECIVCHSSGPGYVIGVEVGQMNRPHDYGGQSVNQIEAFARLGLFKEPPQDLAKLRPLVDPHDARRDLSDRARSYLHANCAHCHMYSGAGNARMRLDWSKTPDQTGIFDVPPEHGTFGIVDGRLVACGQPERSLIYYRMSKLGRGRMPHLGAAFVDERGLALLREWIAQLPAAQPASSEAAKLAQANRMALDAAQLPADPKTGNGRQMDAAGVLLNSTSGALLLLESVKGGALAPPVSKAAIARGTSHANPYVRDLFEHFLPEEQRSKFLGPSFPPEQVLSLVGDASRGRKLFLESSGVQCKSCHRIDRQATGLGPDLSQLAEKKYTLAKLLETIVDPSKEVDQKFRAYTVLTDDGRIYTGLLVRRDEKEIVLRDAQNKPIQIPAASAEEIRPQIKSLMPENLLRDLTAQEAADVLAFILELNGG